MSLIADKSEGICSLVGRCDDGEREFRDCFGTEAEEHVLNFIVRDPFYTEAKLRLGKIPPWYDAAYGIFKMRGIDDAFVNLSALYEENMPGRGNPTIVLDDNGKRELLLFMDALTHYPAKPESREEIAVARVRNYLRTLNKMGDPFTAKTPFIINSNRVIGGIIAALIAARTL